MNNYLKRTNTKHSFGLVIKMTALGVGALAWAAVFGQQASTSPSDDKTAGRDRVDETAGRERMQEAARARASEERRQNEYRLSPALPAQIKPAAAQTGGSSSASPVPAKKSESKPEATERKKESAQTSPTPTARASASPK